MCLSITGSQRALYTDVSLSYIAARAQQLHRNIHIGVFTQKESYRVAFVLAEAGYP